MVLIIITLVMLCLILVFMVYLTQQLSTMLTAMSMLLGHLVSIENDFRRIHGRHDDWMQSHDN